MISIDPIAVAALIDELAASEALCQRALDKQQTFQTGAWENSIRKTRAKLRDAGIMVGE